MTEQPKDAAAEAPKTDVAPPLPDAPVPAADAPAAVGAAADVDAKVGVRDAAQRLVGAVKDAARPKLSLPRPRLAGPKLSAPKFSRPKFSRRHAALAATLCGGIGLGAAGAGSVALMTKPHAEPGPTAAEWKRIVQRLDGSQGDLGRVGVDVKLIREQFAALKEVLEKNRSDSSARFGQLSERIERVQKADTEVANRVASLGERIDRADKDEAARIAALGDRLEKKLVSAAPAPQAAAQPVGVKVVDAVQTGAIPDPKKPEPSSPGVAGWTLREVYDGMAMLENRNQKLLEVTPGATIPGVGRVEAIERRGRAWVVVTSKGLITSQSW